MRTAAPLPVELALIARLRRRDEAAMTLFYDHYAPCLYRAIRQLVPEPAAAEDVLQDSMVKIWYAFEQYEPTRGRLYTWALNVCKHMAIDYLRAQRSRGSGRTEALDTCPQAEQVSGPAFRPEHIDVASWSALLGPKFKCVVDLLYFDGCTQEEAAAVLGIPLGTVKTRARQALLQLASRLHAA